MQLSRAALAGMLALGFGGCLNLTEASVQNEFRFATMNGDNMRPQPTDPTRNGIATTGVVTFAIRGSAADFDIDLFSIDSVTLVTLHLGGTAQSTGSVATLYANPAAPASGSGKLTAGRLDAPDLSGGATMDAVLAAMRDGSAYVQVATKGFPNGAIRGQTLAAGGSPPAERYAATPLNGANERPTAVSTTATGSAYFEETRYIITASGLTGVTAAHIHSGTASEAGPVVVTLFDQPAGTGTVNGTLTTGTFTSVGVTGMTLDSLKVLMRTGNAYVNVHTTANPDGAIRAQIAPVATVPSF